MSNWKEGFVKSLEGSTSKHSQLEEALATKVEHMPKRIYRYQPDSENRRESLANDKIWLCSPDEYNDPYDCEFRFSDTSVEAAAHKRIEKSYKGVNQQMLTLGYTGASHLVKQALSKIRGWRQLYKVCCFSEDPNSMLMWGHYSANHRGFCIEYDLEDPKAEQFRRRLYPVVYSDLPYNLTPWAESLVNGSLDFNPESPILGLIHKFEGWEYEREWRVLEVSNDVKADHDWPVPTPTRVFIGSKMEVANTQVFRTICEPRGIEVLQMHRAEDSFKLFSATFSQ